MLVMIQDSTLEAMRKSRDDYKRKYTKWKKRYELRKAKMETVTLHNDRLRNENIANRAVIETFRDKIKELCPHKEEWIIDEVKWGEEDRYNCSYCHSYILKEEINREI
jgi:hypothetical protein